MMSQLPRQAGIKHGYAVITKARKLLGFESCINLEEGLRQLAS
ncbi:MAG: hypothetical protein ABWK01_06900 [Infirmifilum sp.]